MANKAHEESAFRNQKSSMAYFRVRHRLEMYSQKIKALVYQARYSLEFLKRGRMVQVRVRS